MEELLVLNAACSKTPLALSEGLHPSLLKPPLQIAINTNTMSKKEEQRQQNDHQHVPTESLNTQEKEAGQNTGTGGLLSPVADPVGMSCSFLSPLSALLSYVTISDTNDPLAQAIL
jgi:hypothetical protein